MAKDNSKNQDGITEVGGEADQSKNSSESSRKYRLPNFTNTTPPESSKDPLKSLKEIAKDKDIDPEIREWLLNYAVTRFNNRRKMAYISLFTIIGIVLFLAVGALHDGINECVIDKTCKGVLASVKQIENVLVWTVGFLASIVATYYGVSSFRPSS